MMNILMDELPSTVDVGGLALFINTDYRAGIRFEKLINNKSFTDERIVEEAINIYFHLCDEDARREILRVYPSYAINAIIWFYTCGEEAKSGTDGCGTPEKKLFDYEYDAIYLYASFKQVFGIDLINDKVHWWQFRALFNSLPPESKLMQVIGYRVAEVPEKASDETRQRIERLRQMYALPGDADQIKLETDLDAVLAGDGDVAAFLALHGGNRSNGNRRDS